MVPCCAMDWAVADRDGAVPRREFASPARPLLMAPAMALSGLPKMYLGDRVTSYTPEVTAYGCGVTCNTTHELPVAQV